MIQGLIQKGSDRTALITGGASGIGWEFAKILAEHGWNCILVGRNESKLEAARESLERDYETRAWTAARDLSNPESALELHREFRDGEHRVSLLINNAGIGLFGPVTELSTSDLGKMISLNITSLTYLSKLFAADMAENGGGQIINIGSVAGFNPMPYFAGYGATKSYVHNFSRALRAELAPRGVRVCMVEPGYVKTSFDANANIENEGYLKFSERNGMDPREVALQGLKAAFKGKAQVIPGLSNRLILAVTALVPESLTVALVERSLRKLTS